MITRRPQHELFLRAHRKARKIRATQIAEQLGIERESVYRHEREWWRVDAEMQTKWADALKTSPARLWRPPGPPQIEDILGEVNELLVNASEDHKRMTADVLKRLIIDG